MTLNTIKKNGNMRKTNFYHFPFLYGNVHLPFGSMTEQAIHNSWYHILKINFLFTINFSTMKNLKFYIIILSIFSFFQANAQTTVNLASQCNCEVLSSATEVTAGATSPTGETGQLLVDPSGDIFYWDGDSWEVGTATKTEPWFNVATNTEADGNTQDIYQLGNVGIGTNAPSSKLHLVGGDATTIVSGATTNILHRLTNDAGGSSVIRLETGTSGMHLGITPSNHTYLSNDAGVVREYIRYIVPNEALTLGINQVRVGVGNVFTPTARLDVGGGVRVRSIPAGDATDQIMTTDASGFLRKQTIANVAALSEPWFGTDDSEGATTNTEDIYQLGNVGIGTATPESKLHIVGGDATTSVASSTTNVLSRITNDQGGSVVQKLTTGNQELVFGVNPTFGYNGNTGGSIGIQARDNDSNMTELFGYDQASRNMIIVPLSTNPANNVGIGQVSPSEKLDVTGNIKASGNLQSGTNTYPDYVFEAYENGSSVLNKNYAFKSLEEVESFIKINKHLPGVKSINELEVNEEGKYNVDITATSMQTLEKVEELFLHTIEQEKRIKTLEAELAEIKAMLLKKSK